MSSRVTLAGVVLFAAAGAAVAEAPSGRLNLHEIVANRTVTLHTTVGSFPISYSGNGTMTSRVREHLAYYTGSTSDRGTWWIVADRICHRWQSWLGGKDYCVTLRMDGDKVHWQGTDGHSGTATLGAKPRTLEAGITR